MSTSDELKERFRVALAALVEKHGLDLSSKKTVHSRFLGWWLWGRYDRHYRYYMPRWLDPPKEEWRLRSRIEAFETLAALPTSLFVAIVESWRSPCDHCKG